MQLQTHRFSHGLSNPAPGWSPASSILPQETATIDGACPPCDSIERHAPLVRRVARQLTAVLPPNVELDDMVQVGMIGLMDATSRYDDSTGVPFEAYAASRIRGAMLDELRRNDWVPRSARKSRRDVEDAVHRLEGHLMRAPTDAEIASELGCSTDDYCRLLTVACVPELRYFCELDHLDDDDDDENFLERHAVDEAGQLCDFLHDRRFRTALANAIEKLPEREKLALGLYYEQDMNLQEIGAVLGVTESRISQLHRQAVSRLRARLRSWCGAA